MNLTNFPLLSDFSYKTNIRLSVLTLLVCLVMTLPGAADAANKHNTIKLQGTVESGGNGLPDYKVSLFASYLTGKRHWQKLGTTKTDYTGEFSIKYSLPKAGERHHPLLFVLAEKHPSMLVSVIEKAANNRESIVVINERTTVATSIAYAQFIHKRKVIGNRYGMTNALYMVANMANPETGEISNILTNLPNGSDTSTLETFNSLTNIVAGCVDNVFNCKELFAAATPNGGTAPTTVLQAIANTTKFAGSVDVEKLFQLSFENEVYEGSLPSWRKPTSWLLFIKFTGGFYSDYSPSNLISGPGNIAFDRRGFAWINDNYTPTADLQDDNHLLENIACAGQRLMQFYPWGESVPGSPYFGGGLSGVGFGITLDPKGRVWVGNFGFESPFCTNPHVPPFADPLNQIPARHDSVSVFSHKGTPLSPDITGFNNGDISWPQATVSDPKGNIWLANCGNDSVTLIPNGRPNQAWNISLPGASSTGESPNLKPFGLAIDPKGRAWLTANKAGYDEETGLPGGRVYRIELDGTVEQLPYTAYDNSGSILSWPMGISGDSKGNMWVSNSDSVNVPCVDKLDPQDGDGASIVLYRKDDNSAPEQFTGGGLTIPWGNAVDGNDTLWVFNFGHKPTDVVDPEQQWPDTPLSHFCGVDTSKCPPGLQTGDAISPDEGYVSDALDRITGGGIDQSGNLWLMNNWKKTGPYKPVYFSNPGGNSFVIVPGAASPIKTPLIGPPQGFSMSRIDR